VLLVLHSSLFACRWTTWDMPTWRLGGGSIGWTRALVL
jgi:hypothetical protein